MSAPLFEPVYIADQEVGPELDAELRALFLEAFPHEAGFLKKQRYFRECPEHRWIIFDEQHRPIAHIAVYEKMLETVQGRLSVIGVAEVCVTAPYRGRGFVKRILRDVHAWAREKGFSFAALFGSMAYYGGSGYRPTTNTIRYWKYQTEEWVEEPVEALVLSLGEQVWPEGLIDLNGPMF